ncbi:energy transducer TonB [Flavobacterium terrae]|uniref:Outer membrane transport energization protein TonB n=1 Tax=Flavobacterium terrae TaxID=415425 RepID=A0A1M6GPI0_9FLAO|nr:energy transducer TonB [Flavobacterium terrae]SHJ11901.1 outer membrane transport energization protein TonB [Flavobacterium terrae]
MVLLETKHQKRSFTITVILFVLMFLCFFLYILKDDPNVPEIFEGGEIAINFGTSNVGQGEVQPLEPVKSSPQPKTSKAVETASQNITAQTSTKAPVIKTSQVESTTNSTVKPVVKSKPTPSKSTNDALSSLINGPKSDGAESGHGDDGVPGDKGDPNGDRYANSFYGSGGGTGSGNGSSWGLKGRKLANAGKEVQDCNEEGRVVVQVTVNKNGDVVYAQYTKGTTNTNPCLIKPALATARKFKWQPDSNAPDKQIGFIVINFKLGE